MANILNESDIQKYYNLKSRSSSDHPLSLLNINDKEKDRVMQAKKDWVPPLPLSNFTEKPDFSQNPLAKLNFSNKEKDNIIKAKEKWTPINDLGSLTQQQKPATLKALNLDSYSEEKVTPQILCSIVDMLCENIVFLYIEGMALYVYTDDYYQLFSYSFAGRFLRKIFRQYEINYAFRTSDYKEIVNQLQAQEKITAHPEDCRTNVNIIQFDDGAFVVPDGKMRNARMGDFQFSKINFPLYWSTDPTPTHDAEYFIKRFCSYDKHKEIYLWELIGYLLSNYQEKIMVVFYGPANSGKSTLANFIRRIVGSDTCVALGVRDLSGTFNLAELQGKRLCIDSEMDATTLREKDIAMLKKVVGNDLLQGNRKHEQQFYFQCQTKFLICTNNKIAFHSNEDTIPFLNRIRGFRLEDSIPPDEQCHNMDQILDENRTYFLHRAMEGLQDLVHNNFEFSYPESAEDFVKNRSPLANTASVQEFVDTCCVCDNDVSEPIGTLYDAYNKFARNNSNRSLSKNNFSTTLCEECGFERGKVKGKRCILNLQLKTEH